MHAFKFTFGCFLGFFFYSAIPNKLGKERVAKPLNGGGAGIFKISIGGREKLVNGGGGGGGKLGIPSGGGKFGIPSGGGGKFGIPSCGGGGKFGIFAGGGGKIGIPVGRGGILEGSID